MKIFGFKDCKPGKFINIFMGDNNYSALRDASDVVNATQDSMFKRHPEDFQLFAFGEIDVETGVITPKVEFIENFVALKTVEHQDENDQAR